MCSLSIENFVSIMTINNDGMKIDEFYLFPLDFLVTNTFANAWKTATKRANCFANPIRKIEILVNIADIKNAENMEAWWINGF